MIKQNTTKTINHSLLLSVINSLHCSIYLRKVGGNLYET